MAALSQALELAGGAQQVERVRELGIEYEQVNSELQAHLAQWAEVRRCVFLQASTILSSTQHVNADTGQEEE